MRPGHVLDGQTVGDGSDKVDVDLWNQVAERDDAIVIFAGSDGRGERVRYARQAREVVVGNGVLQPEQVVRLDPFANLNGVVHPPELVDVAHQIDIRTDRL